MKVAVIGGGSTYTPELINGFLDRTNTLPLEELWLMDTDEARLDIVGSFAQRMVLAKGNPFAVFLTSDRRSAVRNATYVINQLRVGKMDARREDEYLGQRHRLVGQETTGIGGIANSLRTIPVVLDLAEDMRKLAPDALLVNFTNPAGTVAEALARYAADIASVSVCNVPITAKMRLLKRLEEKLAQPISPERVELHTLGLNHLSWHRGLTVDGEDMWSQLFDGYLAELKKHDNPEWDIRTLEVLRLIPNYYLQYYYYTRSKLAAQEHWPPSRAETVKQIEYDLLEYYADPAVTEPPPQLMERGGAYYSTVATQLLNAHYNDLGETHVVNIRHEGAVDGWPEEWVLEIPSRVDSTGITPLPADPLPAVCYGLLTQVKSSEILTVEAAVHGDRNAAYQALLAHPLGPKARDVQRVLDDLLETNRVHLPRFWESGGGAGYRASRLQ